jgi:Ca2+-binding RTX toxin-like protein
MTGIVRQGAEFIVNKTTFGDQRRPSVTRLASGGFVIAWEDYSKTSADTDVSAVRAQLFDAAGNPVGAELLVNTAFHGPQSHPFVLGLPGGGFVVTWDDYSYEGGDDSASSVKGRLYDAAGAPVGGEFLVNTTIPGYQLGSSLSVLPGIGFVAVWTDMPTTLNQYGTIHGQIFSDAGEKMGPEFTVNTVETTRQTDALVTTLTDGKFVVMWTDMTFDQVGDGSGWSVRAQMFSPGGQMIGGEFTVNSVVSGNQQAQSLTALASGGFVATWTDTLADGSGWGVEAQVFDAAGHKVGGQFIVNTTTIGNQDDAYVVPLGDGGFLVTWTDASYPGPLGVWRAVKAQAYTAGGAPNGGEFTVDSFNSLHDDPTLAWLGGDTVLAVWHGGNGPDAGQYSPGEIRAQMLTVTRDASDDYLPGTTGADQLVGGLGNDTYLVDNPGDVVIEKPGEGADEVRTSLSNYHLPDNVENLTGLLSTEQTLVGNELDNLITAGSGGGWVYAGGGNDRVEGGNRNDLIYGDTGAYFQPASAPGDDVLNGGAGNDELYGEGGNDVLDGGPGNDWLGGGPGQDVLIGGTGNDTYLVYDAGDTVIENAGEGTDEVRTSLASYTLPANVEWLWGTVGTGQALTGNGLANFIIGGGGNDILDGGAGHDFMSGGRGDDIYYVDDYADTVSESADQGIDEVRTAMTSYTLPGDVENLVETGASHSYLAGNGGDNIITLGTGGANVDLSAGGHDSVRGAAGDDILFFGGALDALDRVDGGGGTNEVQLLGNYTGITLAPLLANVGTLTLMSLASGFNGAGRDGTATYALAAGDLDAPDGRITVNASGLMASETVSFDGSGSTRAAFTLEGGAGDDALTGGGLADLLAGGGGNDVLDGRAGADTMAGGAGNDVYYVDDANDVVLEYGGEGYDEVRTTIANYALPANVEKLTYVGTGNFTYAGGAGNDDVAGAGGNDFFDLSQGGSDTVSGGGGNDAFAFGAAWGAGDSVDGGAGFDTIGLQGNYTGANKAIIATGQLTGVEQLTLMSGNGAGGIGYDITLQDGNLANGQQLTVYAGALKAGENVTFDGSAETHGYFVYYGGLGTDNVKGGASSDGFYFGPGKFTQADSVDGGGGSQNQLGLDGSYDFEAGSALGTLGGNFTNIQSIVLYRGNPADATAPYPNSYHIEVNDGAVAAGRQLTIYGIPVVSSLYFDGSGETDGSFRILSGTGDDVLKGSHGNDVLFGNLGADLMAGNGGNDIFLYTDTAQSIGAGTDHIFDFSSGDRLDLSGIDANTTQAGDQAFTWIGSGAFTNHAGELHAEFDGNQWLIAADTDGDGHADLTILLNTADGHILSQNDFTL